MIMKRYLARSNILVELMAVEVEAGFEPQGVPRTEPRGAAKVGVRNKSVRHSGRNAVRDRDLIPVLTGVSAPRPAKKKKKKKKKKNLNFVFYFIKKG